VNQDFIGLALAEVMPAARQTGLFSSLATFQSPSQVFDSGGAFAGTYIDVAGLVNIPCTPPPESTGSISAGESRGPQEIIASGRLHVLLDDYYPAVNDGWRGTSTNPGPWRMLINGNAFEIEGVDPGDSQRKMTRIAAHQTTM